MGVVAEVTDATFEQLVINAEGPVVVDYWATWCAPCKQLAPILEELATAHGDKITFLKIDADANPVTPAEHRVQGLPTIQVWSGGSVVKSFKGAKSKSTLLKALEDYL